MRLASAFWRDSPLLLFGVLTYFINGRYLTQRSYSLSWELKLAAVWGDHGDSLLLLESAFT